MTAGVEPGDDADAYTEGWYREQAERFAARTRDLPMTELHEGFLSLLPDGAFILDVGCGSGRDMKAFADRGFVVEGLERSPELAQMAESFSGGTVRVMAMEDLDAEARYDGIWASASLLHTPIDRRLAQLVRFRRALRARGVLYLSLKEGVGRRIDAEDGRVFYDISEEGLRTALEEAGFPGPKVWRSTSLGSRVPDQVWINAIAHCPREPGIVEQREDRLGAPPRPS